MEVLEQLENQIINMKQYPPLLPKQTQSKPKLGPTLSIEKGMDGLVKQMLDMNATSVSFFLSSNRQWNVKLPTKQQLQKFQQVCQEQKLTREQFLPHAPYLINVCSIREDVKEKSEKRLLIDVAIARMYGFDRINFHPGSTEDKKLGIRQVAEQCNRIIEIVPDIVLVLETMPGKTKVCNSFQECKEVIDLIKDKSRIGVCVDTQHCWAGGFVQKQNYGLNLINEFNKIIGQQYLYGIHFNNSKKEYDSNVDRHESIEHGLIPISELKNVIQLKLDLPICLETPQPELWKDEIKLMFKWWNEK